MTLKPSVCRHCASPLSRSVLDLGYAPPSNAYLSEEQLHQAQKYYPLRVLVCDVCFLMQTQDYAAREDLFSEDYAYFSSMSSSWLAHAAQYAEEATERFLLNSNSLVVEIASNDGYLLQYFQQKNISCLGVEPTHSTAQAAKAKGLRVVEDFFGLSLAQKLKADYGPADLMIANNVLAHVPNLHDFLAGFACLLAENGVLSFEFPHLQTLLQGLQFDTVYHEHYSYLSLHVVATMCEAHQLKVFDVQKIATHGGSLRVWVQPALSQAHFTPESLQRVQHVLQEEQQAGLQTIGTYQSFQALAEQVKNGLLQFLLQAKQNNWRVAAYGAAAKGNTLLNFAGVRADLLQYVVDKSPGKLGKFLPGSLIPIVDEVHLLAHKPDVVLILPWNLKDEISQQLAYIRNWGGRFAIAIPELIVF